MGVRKQNKIEWNEYKIQKALKAHFLSQSSKKYELCNLFVYDWESDYLAITRSDIAYECEIKISRQDFINDSKKHNKHLIISEGKMPYERPNYFYYAVPEGLIDVDEVPQHAGLIYVSEFWITIKKPAVKVHDGKFDYDKTKLMDKLYYNYTNYRTLYKENDIPTLKKKISRLENQIMEYDDELSLRTCEIDELNNILKKNNINVEH